MKLWGAIERHSGKERRSDDTLAHIRFEKATTRTELCAHVSQFRFLAVPTTISLTLKMEFEAQDYQPIQKQTLQTKHFVTVFITRARL